jgi:ectoine hydroxylase-related dioxygenase (phytanoyl-CoA dioxygenase family)
MASDLAPQLQSSFARDGFVVTPDVFTEKELRRYGAVVDEEVVRRTATDRRELHEKSTYEQSFVQCMRLWETNPEIRPLTLHRGLAEIAATLLGVEAVRLWQDQALYKEPGGRITDPHQDAPFWPVGDAPMISAWIPFEGSTIESGAMAYVPGSHKAGRLRPVDITHTTVPYDILQDPALGGSAPVVVEAPIGSVVWHHGMTVHQAAVNQTDRVRRVFTVVYLADGFRKVGQWPTFPLDRDGVGDGDLMAGPGMPIVWPPQGGEEPKPHSIQGGLTGPQVREGA